MINVVGVRFKKAGKIYYFDPGPLDIDLHESVIVETARGIEFGKIVIEKRPIKKSTIVSPLKSVLRVATEDDHKVHRDNKRKAKEAFSIFREKTKLHKLDMNLIDVEYTFDNNKVIFYFTAEGRVDFRELVKDLASIFKTRIELRQIGVRDEAKAIGGIGPCGNKVCCKSFLGDFQPVSIKMAKEQNLSLNPSKISGLCGRLMCCLKYEQDNYEELLKKMPPIGAVAMTEDGRGVVVETFTLLEKAKLRVRLPEDIEELRIYKIDEIKLTGEMDKYYQRFNSRDDLETVDMSELKSLEE